MNSNKIKTILTLIVEDTHLIKEGSVHKQGIVRLCKLPGKECEETPDLWGSKIWVLHHNLMSERGHLFNVPSGLTQKIYNVKGWGSLITEDSWKYYFATIEFNTN